MRYSVISKKKNPAKRSSIEILKDLSSSFSLVAVPVAVALVGSYYTVATKEREVSAKFVELAVGILSKEPSKNAADQGIRRWATNIIDQYSGVKFDDTTRNDLITTTTLPKLIDTPISGGSHPVNGVRRVDRIVVRDTQQEDFQKEIRGLGAFQVAYHYLIEKDGTLHRLKDENEIAFHTSGFNESSIGIGMLHRSGSDYTREQIDSLTNLIGDIVKRRQITKANINAASELQPGRNCDFSTVKDQILSKLPG